MKPDTSDSILQAATELHLAPEFHAALDGTPIPDAKESALVLSITREARRQMGGSSILMLAQLEHLGKYARYCAASRGMDIEAQKRVVTRVLEQVT